MPKGAKARFNRVGLLQSTFCVSVSCQGRSGHEMENGGMGVMQTLGSSRWTPRGPRLAVVPFLRRASDSTFPLPPPSIPTPPALQALANREKNDPPLFPTSNGWHLFRALLCNIHSVPVSYCQYIHDVNLDEEKKSTIQAWGHVLYVFYDTCHQDRQSGVAPL